MTTLNLQNPRGKRWPDFFGSKPSVRATVEASPAVQSLIHCGVLLTKDLNSLLYDFLIKNQEIRDLLTPVALTDAEWDQITDTAVESFDTEKLRTMEPEPRKEYIRATLEQVADQFRLRKRQEQKQRIVMLSKGLVNNKVYKQTLNGGGAHAARRGSTV